MQPDKDDLKYLWDMLESARTIVELTQGRTLTEYEQTKWLRLAVERSIEIIGEAARRVSDETKASLPTIQWAPIIATRHIIAHEYGDLQNDKLWRIATTHVPALIAQLAPIIQSHPPGDSSQTSAPKP